MNSKKRSQPNRQKVSAGDKDCVRVERRPDGNYNITMTGHLAEKFMAVNKNLEDLKSRKVSEVETFGHLLDEAISYFESNNPLDAEMSFEEDPDTV